MSTKKTTTLTDSRKVHRNGPCALTSQAGLAVPSLGKAALFHEGGVYRGLSCLWGWQPGDIHSRLQKPSGKKYDVMPQSCVQMFRLLVLLCHQPGKLLQDRRFNSHDPLLFEDIHSHLRGSEGFLLFLLSLEFHVTSEQIAAVDFSYEMRSKLYLCMSFFS